MSLDGLTIRGRQARFGVRFQACLAVLLMLAGCQARVDTLLSDGPPRTSASSNRGTPHETSQSAAAISFQNMASRAGIDFAYRDGQEAGFATILEAVGGGIACFDMDLDDDLDLLAPGGGRFSSQKSLSGLPCALYINEGGWSFRDVAAEANFQKAPFYSHGALVGDYDNDGFPDALITGYGGLLLFRNQGDGTFQEVAETAGLIDKLWSTAAGWGDINGDGAVDLYVTHYVNWSFNNDPRCFGPQGQKDELCGPREFESLPDSLFLSNADGTFYEASREYALRTDGKGLSVLMADFDMDGHLDIYVGNDATPNFLYRNSGDGALEEIGLISGTSLGEHGNPDGSMGIDVGDYNLDGQFDIWVANFEQESFALYEHRSNWLFKHVSRQTGVMDVGQLFVGWGTCFFDADRDGDEELFVSNGHVIRYPTKASVRQLPLLLKNENRRYRNVAANAGAYLSTPHLGRGAAAGDLDKDGDLDLTVSHINEPLAILSNTTENANHWLSIRLIGAQSNRDAVGAVVQISTNSQTQIRQVKGGGSFASSSDPRLFFGLGLADKVDRIEVHWPSGAKTTAGPMAANQRLTLIEPVQSN